MNTKRPWMLAALMVSALWLWRPASAAQDADAPVATQPADRSTVALSTRDPVPPTRPFDARPSAQPSVLLYTGQVQVLDMPNVSRVAVGNRGVLYAYEVTVRSNDTVRAARDIQDMLVNEPGLRVTPYDGHVLIEGDYSNPATSRKLDAIAQMFPQGVVSLVPDHRVQPPVPLEK